MLAEASGRLSEGGVELRDSSVHICAPFTDPHFRIFVSQQLTYKTKSLFLVWACVLLLLFVLLVCCLGWSLRWVLVFVLVFLGEGRESCFVACC